MMPPTNDCAVIAPDLILDRMRSVNGSVGSYSVRVSSPRRSGRISSGTPRGSWYSGAGTPSIVLPWLYSTFTAAGRPPRDAWIRPSTASNADRSMTSM